MADEDTNTGRAIANPGSPVFLLGFARSGTSWLAISLRDYLSVGMVNEGTFITDFGRRQRADRNLADPARLAAEIENDEFTRILKQAYDIETAWPRDAGNCSYADFIRHGLIDIAHKLDCRFIGSKSPGFGLRLPVLLRHFPNAAIVHLIRDGRDCALSHYDKIWGRTNAYVVASKWRDYIDSVRRQSHAAGVHYIEIHYEDLLRAPAAQFEQIANFVLALDHHVPEPGQAQCATQRFAASVRADAYDKRAYKWRRSMSAADVALFNRTAGECLRALGYQAERRAGSVPAWRRGYY